MGIVGQYIDRCAKVAPELIRPFLEHEPAPLAWMTAWDHRNGRTCGCLVGEGILAAESTGAGTGSAAVAALIGWTVDAVDYVAGQVAWIAVFLDESPDEHGGSPLTVAILRRRIALALLIEDQRRALDAAPVPNIAARVLAAVGA